MKPVEQLHKKHADSGTRPSVNEISRVLRNVLSRSRLKTKIFVVIDALDSCREDVRLQFLARILELQAVRDLHLMVTSRSLPEVTQPFKGALHLYINDYWEQGRRFFAIYRLPTHIYKTPLLQEIVQDMVSEAADSV